jgi:hypothetical protein
MRALVWITEASWETCVDHARQLLPVKAEVTILHVAASDVERLAEHPGPGLLGRRHRPPPAETVREISDAEARSLLAAAAERLGRPADTLARRGRIEREVVQASADFDVLVLVRDGEPRRGPKSIGRDARFVVDHTGCSVLLGWAAEPPGLDSMHWPPHLR